MMNYITAKIRERDIFAYSPEQSLLYKFKTQFQTFAGGCTSLIYIVNLGIIWYLQVYIMLTYGNNSTSENSTKGDMTTIFEINDYLSLPTYGVKYKTVLLPRYSNSTEHPCREFNGDCLEFTLKHFYIEFGHYQTFENKTNKYK